MLLEGGEEQVTQLRPDTRPVDRPCAQGTPDLLHPAALEHEDSTGEPIPQILLVLVPGSIQRLIDQSEQLGGQATLEPDHRFRPVAPVIVVRGEQIPLLMQMHEVAIGVLC